MQNRIKVRGLDSGADLGEGHGAIVTPFGRQDSIINIE